MAEGLPIPETMLAGAPTWSNNLAGCHLRNSADLENSAFSHHQQNGCDDRTWLMEELDMLNSDTLLSMDSGVAAVSLTDADLERVAGGIFFLPIVAGIVVGAIVGGATLATLVAAADAVSHHTGHGCLLA